MLGVGAVLVGLSWIGSRSRRDYYGACTFGTAWAALAPELSTAERIGNALKWFPDHRGLCVGLTAGAYGIGTALTVSPIDKMIKAPGYQHTLIVWGIIQGIRRAIAAPSSWPVHPRAGRHQSWAEKEAKIKQREALHPST